MPDLPTRIAIAVVERNGEFLVGERPPGKPLAGCAEFPGGRVEAGETPEQAAVRECFEETGLHIAVVSRYDECEHDYAHDRVHLHFFACRAVGASVEPRFPFRWVPRANLRTLDFPEANLALLSVLVADEISD
ncbi:MAG TPA: (deoxy)nucleoside triphosphate pyrophosphohydrolase [Pirellulaceae bacterium]|nr:(deoxy)nucleoside triphosphate pyrophosphohydrolase [Pirellulaceae bacterium]